LVKGGAEPIEYCALGLVVGAGGVDDLPADIACRPDLVDLGGTIRCDARLDDLGEVAVVTVVEREPHARTARQLLATAPPGLLGNQLEDPTRPPGVKRRLRAAPTRRQRYHARRTVEVETEIERIAPRSMRQLVDEGLEGEGERVAARIAQRTGRDTELDQRLSVLQARNETGREMLRGEIGRAGDSIPLAESNEMIAEGVEPAFGREPCLEVVETARPIRIVLNVLAPVPEKLHRPPGQLRDHGCLDHVVALEPPPESAAHARHVHRDPARAYSERLGHQLAPPAGVLRGRPDLDAAVALVVCRAVLWLEVHMRQERIRVRGFQHLVRVSQRLVDMPIAADDGLRLLPRKLRGLPLDRRRALLGIGRPIPDDAQLLERLLRLPPAVGEDGYTVDEAYLEHGLRIRPVYEIGLVDGVAILAKHRRLLVSGIHHARQHRIDPEKRLAVEDPRAVDPA